MTNSTAYRFVKKHFDVFKDALPELAERIVTQVREAASGKGGGCYECSYLEPVTQFSVPTKKVKLAVIDVGGTHTKAIVSTHGPEGSSRRVLFDLVNGDLVPQERGDAPPLEIFWRNVARQFVGETSTLDGIGVVWSNQITAKLFKDSDTRGVTASISGISAGTYLKDEWFIQGLSDGYDLGALIRNTFREAGCVPKLFLISNDTPAVLGALPGAQGGVVASSGANCTSISEVSGTKRIFNTELGSLFLVGSNLLSPAEQALCKDNALPLEYLNAGAFLPKLFERHLSDRVAEYSTRSMVELLQSLPLASDMSLLIRSMIERAAYATALLCVGSIATQEIHSQKAKIALDSSMARYLPGFMEALSVALIRLDRPIEVTLLQPIRLESGGEISVPLQGLEMLLLQSKEIFL